MKTAKSEIELLIAEVNRCYWPVHKDALVSKSSEFVAEWDNARDFSIHKNKKFLSPINVWAINASNYVVITCILKSLLLKDVIKQNMEK